MLTRYSVLFRVHGAAAFCVTGFFARLSISMYPIGLVLLISLRTHHYSFAGLLVGAYVAGEAPGAPLVSRWVDRVGQRRVLVPGALAHLAAIAALVALAESGAPEASYLAPAFLAGFSYPPIVSLVRTRWSYVMGDRPERETAYSLESALDEVIFVIGPLVATLLATQVSPVAPLIFGGAMTTGGSLVLAGLKATDPPPHPRSDTHRSPLRSRGMPTMLWAGAAMGAVFASAEVAMVAYCGQHHRSGLSGLVLACFALGSAVSGFTYGAIAWRAELLDRFRVQAVIFGVLPVLLLAAFNVGVLGGLAVVVGLGIAPLLITSFGLVEKLVPAASLNEGLSWLLTGINVGYGVGAALVGRLADAHGARSAFTLCVGAGLATAALAAALHAIVRRSSATDDGAPVTPVVG